MQMIQRVVTAADQFTEAKLVVDDYVTLGVNATGAFTATLRLQVRPGQQSSDALNPWLDLLSLTANGVVSSSWPLGGEWQVRVGCKAAEFTSSAATLNVWGGIREKS